MQKVYQDAQAAYGLKVDDYVKVIRNTIPGEAGWGNDIIAFVSAPVGQCGHVINILKDRIQVNIRGEVWGLPYFVLEKVEKPAYEFKPYDHVLVRDRDDDCWWPDIFLHKSPDNEQFSRCTRGSWMQCIPYKGNEHLVGTRG